MSRLSPPKPAAGAGYNPWKPLFRNGQFRWLLAGNVTLFFGFSATLLLRSLLAWQLTGDEMSLAYINVIAAVCMFGASIFSGAIVDRFERRKLMIYSQWVIVVTEAAVLILLAVDHLSFNFLVLSAIAASAMFPFIMPARTAMMVETVGRPSIGKANTLMAGGMNVARMVSPAVVGIMVEFIGIAWGYLFLVVLHLCSLACNYKLQHSIPAEVSNRGAFLAEVKEGFAYIFRHPSLGMCIVFGLIPVLVTIPLQNMMVVFTEQVWHAGGAGLGIMMAATGVGGVIGSLLMAFQNDDSLVKPMVISALIMGILLVILCNITAFPVAVLIVLGIYSMSVFAYTHMQTGVQLMAEDRVRGRITTMTMMIYGLAPLGTLPLAYATKHIGAAPATTVAGFILVAAVLLVWLYSPAFRNIDNAVRSHNN
ncbi:MAG: MFS transporter [Porticoccaceae bacterium]|nr:MFS transporter [Porticoccaceae bacterium]